MGFWHTGYMEFHEPTGFDERWVREPKAPEFPCPECGLVFATERDKRAHQFDGHSYQRPILVFRGRECGRSRLMVTTPSISSDWYIANATSVSLNGQASSPVDVATYLSEIRFGVQAVTVQNISSERTFEFDFCLAEEEDLDLVDQALNKLISGRVLDRSTIDAFIMRAGRGQTARRYREGIANYLYGALLREAAQDDGASSNEPSQIYEERYNRAVNYLGDFDRRPAEVICGVVAFHYNQFDLAIRKTNSHRVSDVAARFTSMMAGSQCEPSSLLDRAHGSLDQALCDSVTSDLLDVCAIALDGSENGALKSVLTETSELRPEDQFKVHLIAAEAFLASGDLDGAVHYSEILRNYRDTDTWYVGFRKRMRQVEN